MNIETMVVDEVSMARADIIDGIDFTLKKQRHDERSFGGIQMIFVGDLYQLPPVISDKEKVVVTFDGKLHYEGTLQGYFEKIYQGQYFLIPILSGTRLSASLNLKTSSGKRVIWNSSIS